MGLFTKKRYDSKKNKTLLDSFSHAYDGIKYVFVRERNIHIHITIGILVIILGTLFEINYSEWLTCFILIGIIIAMEMINTSIEAVVDLITTEDNHLAKVAKDASAGAVLFMSMVAAFIGIIIFLPKVSQFVLDMFV